MSKTQNQTDYAKSSFSDVAQHYDEIQFFKTSAQHICNLVIANLDKPQANPKILDVACGTGNVSIALAKALPKANILGLDLSQSMLDKAIENARQFNLTNTHFKTADICEFTNTEKFDVITLSYVLFFLPDAPQVLNKLKTQLSTNGNIIFTSFQEQAFQPASDILLSLLRQYKSNSALNYEEHSWTNLQHQPDIEKLCKLAHLNIQDLIQKKIRYSLTIDEWWILFNNTGYKGMLLELNQTDYHTIRAQFFQLMRENSAYQNQTDSLELIADSFFVIAD